MPGIPTGLRSSGTNMGNLSCCSARSPFAGTLQVAQTTGLTQAGESNEEEEDYFDDRESDDETYEAWKKRRRQAWIAINGQPAAKPEFTHHDFEVKLSNGEIVTLEGIPASSPGSALIGAIAEATEMELEDSDILKLYRVNKHSVQLSPIVMHLIRTEIPINPDEPLAAQGVKGYHSGVLRALLRSPTKAERRQQEEEKECLFQVESDAVPLCATSCADHEIVTSG